MLTIGGMCQSSLLFRLREIETESLVLEESNRSLSTSQNVCRIRLSAEDHSL